MGACLVSEQPPRKYLCEKSTCLDRTYVYISVRTRLPSAVRRFQQGLLKVALV